MHILWQARDLKQPKTGILSGVISVSSLGLVVAVLTVPFVRGT